MVARLPARRVGLFTEIFEPVVNGVVASVDRLGAALRDAGDETLTIAPWQPGARERIDVIRLPSFPLPTSSGYRLVVPRLDARANARIDTMTIAHAHTPFVNGWFAHAIARRLRVPLVFTYHTRLEAYAHYAPFAGAATRAALRALTLAFANRADAVIAPTHAIADDLRALGVRTPISVVPSAIDLTLARTARRDDMLRARIGARPHDRIALVVARLAREKNVALALDALAACDGARLVIVGEGPERASLAARARSHGISDRVHFTGALPPAQVAELYASSDAFAFTSTTETQGLVLAEALAARLPIVAVDGAVAREVAGPHARFVPADPRAFAVALGAALGPGAGPPPADAAERFAPAAFAAAVRSVYDRAQSAAHLAL
jgi:glycosyltransferase involved in cell wall biosynthesis